MTFWDFQACWWLVCQTAPKTVVFRQAGPDRNINNICEDEMEVINLNSLLQKMGWKDKAKTF